jgi:hypothetical protein
MVSLRAGYVKGMSVVVVEMTSVREIIVIVWFGIVRHVGRTAIFESTVED